MADTTRLVFTQKDRVGAWVAERVGQKSSWGSFYAMGIERDGEIVGGIVFNDYNGSNATCHIAVEKMSKMLIQLIQAGADYAFRQCKLKRLTGLVTSSNTKALALDKHIGFEHEFTMPKAGLGDDDMVVLVLWPHNFRY